MYRLVPLLFLVSTAHAEIQDSDVAKTTRALMPKVEREYKWFHQHPEVSLKEQKTAAHLAGLLRNLGMEVHEGIGGHGIVGILRSAKNPSKRVVLYRADMDGLPVVEKTGVAYASKNQGVMHACGHDTHMASAVGALAVLAKLSDRWEGTVVFVGQPAEELGLGAKAMLDDRRFKRLLRANGMPTVALALHDTADVPAGKVALVPGYAYANVDSVDITIFGKGGHGARPNQAVDPIVIGANVVMALQTIRSRKIAGNDPGVITVGQFTGGTKHNIIPDTVTLKLTVRSYSESTRQILRREIVRITENTARAHGAPKRPKVSFRDDEFTPSSKNDPRWTKRLSERFAEVLGKNAVVEDKPTMGGEDFGRFSQTLGIPGVMWKLGGANRQAFRKTKGEGLPGLHSGKWAPELKPTLETGVRTAASALLLALTH